MITVLSTTSLHASLNFLQLNQDKTENLVIGAKAERDKISDHLKSFARNTKEKGKNLGVITDSDLNLECHIRNVTKVSFYHIRNIAKVRLFLSQADTEKLVCAFISSRLDYCNALLSGVSKKAICQLQLVQNTAARVLTKSRQRTHITPILKLVTCL